MSKCLSAQRGVSIMIRSTLSLLLLAIGMYSMEISANPVNISKDLAITTEETLTDPIPEPILKGHLRLRLKLIAQGLTAPNWAMPAPGDTDHLYVGDQNGKLWKINLLDGSKESFLDLSQLLVPLGVFGENSFDERGFLGFAFHPQYVENSLLYTYTSEPAGEKSDFSTISSGSNPNHRSVIREWRINSANLAKDMPNRVLLSIDQPQFNHNAGALNFGPDGMLYIALGDGGGADDRDGQPFIGEPIIGHGTHGNGQDLTNPLGSLLRIDPSGTNSINGQYGIPNDNPFSNSNNALGEIYAYGFRNPFRFSFDSVSGSLLLADVGQNAIEEVNIVKSGGNYGWGLKEGRFRFEPNGNGPGFITNDSIIGDFIDPILEYDHDEGTAIVGGFVYQGKMIPELKGHYVFGDVAKTSNGDGRLFYSDGSKIQELDLTQQSQPGFWVLGFGQDNNGELYVLGNSTGLPFGSTGVVYKIVPNSHFDGTEVEIPAVKVITSIDKAETYHARLRLIPDSQPLRFELIHAEKLPDRSDRIIDTDNAIFNSTMGTLNLPFINIVSQGSEVATYQVQLRQVSDQPTLTFELTQSVLIR